MNRHMPMAVGLAVLLTAWVTSVSMASDKPDQPTEPAPDLLSRAVTEEVGPGVDRILSDGYRDISPPVEDYQFDDLGNRWSALARSHEYRHVVAGADHSVWILEPDRFFRLGQGKTWDWEGQPKLTSTHDFEVAADGTLWRVAGHWLGNARSFNGRQWRWHRTKDDIQGVESQPDGTVWTAWWRPTGSDEGYAIEKLSRWNGKRWKTIDVPRIRPSYGRQFQVLGDDIWLCCKDKGWAERQRPVRFDGKSWQVIADPAPLPEGELADAPLLIDGVDDGTLWMRRSSTTLARHDDEGWTVFTTDAGGPIMGWTQEEGGFLRGSPDGSAWVTVSTGKTRGIIDCDGLARFDGHTWTRYLSGSCIFAIDIAPDGTAWLQAARMDPDDGEGLPLEPVQTYAIVPTTIGPDV